MILAWYHGEKGHQRVTRTETLLLAAVLLFGTGALVGTLGDPATGPEAPSDEADPGPDTGGLPVDPTALAVLPLVPTTPDPPLRRLGRDLAVTLAATLDGLEELRTVDAVTILAQQPPDSAPLPLPAARALAARLGAGRLLRGTLTRQRDGIRIDATLYEAGPRPTARTSTLVPPDADLNAATDSVTLALIRRLWHGSSPELPSAAALGTGSAEALRAYVEGEEAMAAGKMGEAVTAFERAFAHDSTYWFAYWRSLYPRIYEGSRADPGITARIVEHRGDFPAGDSLLVEAQMAGTVRERLRILEEATRRFPTHWPAWYTLGNLLVHYAPYVGTSYPEARAAFERVLDLNPGFSGALGHLFWLAVHQRDTVATSRILQRLESYEREGGTIYSEDLLTYYRAAAGFVAGGDSMGAAPVRDIAAYIDDYAGPLPTAAFGVGLLIFDLEGGTVQLANAVLDRRPRAALATSMWRGKAYAWAGRGAWDSAAVAVERWTRSDGSWLARLGGYGLLTSGAALGAVEPDLAKSAHPGPPPEDTDPDQRAELAWLDGVVAWAQSDEDALEAARVRLDSSGGRFRPLLGGSLDALRLDAAGRRDEAIAALTAVEDSAGNHFEPEAFRFVHPHISTVDRVLLGRWLLEAGRPADAVRLLSWYEAILPSAPPLEIVNRTVGGLGVYERARAEQAMGRTEDARTHFRRFLRSVDRPTASLRPLVEDAEARLRTVMERLPG